MRQLRLRMSDETIRSVMVDENQPIANLMVIICTKLGITNHDEYSLIATGKHTINGRRKERLEGRIIDQKMEQLKKKLKTDEDLAWVDHSKTLDEQEIHEQDVVLLRRRFFYSDHNVDSRDPIQLGLLYVQTRDAILSGTHPVTVDGACKFAGIQCQAQLGDFMEGKTTRPGYMNLKDYLPADYVKQKHIERKIFDEHKKYYGLSELEAKAKYVGEARILPTYGVTFFLVKEKVPGKNKLVPRLLGLTKDCVMRVDADTKGILKTWPLTTVKRWAASMNSFTLDFGDYSDSYYSAQTTEGEQISQLIAGYIDIILKRRKPKDHFGIEGDEGATMVEDSVAPSRATIIQNQPAVQATPTPPAPEPLINNSVAGPQVQKMRRAEGPFVEPPDFRPAVEVRGKAEIGYESRPMTQYVTNYELTLPQRDLQDRLELAEDAVEEAQKVLDRPQPSTTSGGGGSDTLDQLNRLESGEMEQKKRRLSSQFAEINAATAQLVSLSAIPEEELNYPALNSAVETVASSLPTVAKDVKYVASLMDDEESGERLIDAARRLCKAFSDLLNAAEPGPTVPRQSLISAASRVGDATQALLYTINGVDSAGEKDNEELQKDREQADELLSLAKSVASSAAALVLKAKDFTKNYCQDDEPFKNLVIGSATQCALATSQMVATAKIVAPTIHDPHCQRKLIESCRRVQQAVEIIQNDFSQRGKIQDKNLLCEVNEAIHRVNEAQADLIEHIKSIKRQQQVTTTTTTTRIIQGGGGGSSTNNNNSQSNTHSSSHQNNSNTTNITTTVHKIVNESTGRTVNSNNNFSSIGDDYHYNLEREDHEHERQEDPAKSELVSQARNLAKVTAELIQEIRPEAKSQQQQQQYQHHHQPSHGHQYQQQELQQHLFPDWDRQNSRPQSVYETSEQKQHQHDQQEIVNSTTTTSYKLESSYEEQRREIEEESNARYNSLRQQQDQFDQADFPPPPPPQLSAGDTQRHREATISGIVGDLETSIMFATAGTLKSDDEYDTYFCHRENVLRCAKALVEDTRPLVTSTANDQRHLAQAAQESVFTMSQLAETVKQSAASLGPQNAESQVSLIRSVKDVAESLADLIGSTKLALGCEQDDPRLMQVKESAKSMVSSVTSLLRTVKSVEDEQQRPPYRSRNLSLR